ncbi:thioredoxin-like protein [Absidia repens]|uniref:Thioredoxin-like protein n=1 Tax=Absidia repens TaxID=90262 RepID=A0A1X2IZN4_9FUNG|nr:thioredoxin-like protein [Absidia repens]
MKFLSLLILLSFAFGYYAQVIQVTDANFDQLVKKSDQWVVEFYADWCGYCTRFAPVYDIVEENIRTTNYQPIYFGKVNIDENPALAARFFVSRLPTLFHVHQHQVRALPLTGDVSLMIDSLKHQEWTAISPIGGWRSPYGLFGRLLGWTGYSVKILSTVSPWQMIGLLFGLLVCGLGLTSYFSPRPSSLAVNEEPSVSSALAAGLSSSTAINNKSSNTQKRPSRRID